MSAIEWTQQTWNPIAGCTKVSPGCANCYAEVMAGRLDRMGMTKYQGLTVLQGKHARWTGKIAFDERVLLKPLQTKKPTTYFVNSMSDLFHEGVTDEQIDRIFAVMALCPQHTFQVLTKRPQRMGSYLREEDRPLTVSDAFADWHEMPKAADALVFRAEERRQERDRDAAMPNFISLRWPLPNVWLGVSVENQATANERIPLLLDTPAAVRFISAEPLLGPFDLPWLGVDLASARWIEKDSAPESFKQAWAHMIAGGPGLDWVIVGGESGYGSRECDIEWIRSIVKQCKAANVPVFVKQLGMKPYVGKPGNRLKQLDKKKGGWMDSWPEDLRVRQMSEVSR